MKSRIPTPSGTAILEASRDVDPTLDSVQVEVEAALGQVPGQSMAVPDVVTLGMAPEAVGQLVQFGLRGLDNHQPASGIEQAPERLDRGGGIGEIVEGMDDEDEVIALVARQGLDRLVGSSSRTLGVCEGWNPS